MLNLFDLNQADLLADSRTEKDQLMTELKEMLEQTSRQAQLERKANEAKHRSSQAEVELSQALILQQELAAENDQLKDPDRMADICDITGDVQEDPGSSPSEASTEKKAPVKII